ncbi:Arc family DNA-binding protein [Acinetobacter sp. ABJ_C5_2]|uniref:Arc family DNA-binding protein n=1 Tax=Acinetobacter sp. ABJ_C5_2 TaxID=3376992 RepID=UPI0037C70365
MAKDYSQVNFRIPTKLKEDLEQKAKENERSLTAEIVVRLEESLSSKISSEEAIMWKEEAEALTAELRDMLIKYRHR